MAALAVPPPPVEHHHDGHGILSVITVWNMDDMMALCFTNVHRQRMIPRFKYFQLPYILLI
jgi:hypothetical protein